MANTKKVLIIRLSSIGDIVLTSALVRCLYQSGYHHIDFLTKSNYAEVAKAIPYISKVLTVKETLLATASMIRVQHYDLVIDLHHKIYTIALRLMLPTHKFYVWKKQSLQKRLYVFTKLQRFLPQFPVVQSYFNAIKKLNITYDHNGIAFQIDTKAIEIPITLPPKYNVWVMGATHFTKRMPIVNAADIINSFTLPTLLIGGKDVKDEAENLQILTAAKTINLCGRTNIATSAFLMQNASCTYTQDTGMMHIAAALDCTIISFWGGTIPEMGFKPLVLKESDSIIIEKKDLSCRPCSKYGRKYCPKKHFSCMKLSSEYFKTIPLLKS